MLRWCVRTAGRSSQPLSSRPSHEIIRWLDQALGADAASTVECRWGAQTTRGTKDQCAADIVLAQAQSFIVRPCRAAIDPHGFAALARTMVGHARGAPRGDSITSSTRIRFSVHTTAVSCWEAQTRYRTCLVSRHRQGLSQSFQERRSPEFRDRRCR
jgi:hypothetical protein